VRRLKNAVMTRRRETPLANSVTRQNWRLGAIFAYLQLNSNRRHGPGFFWLTVGALRGMLRKEWAESNDVGCNLETPDFCRPSSALTAHRALNLKTH
jgi:hypothetical protein